MALFENHKFTLSVFLKTYFKFPEIVNHCFSCLIVSVLLFYSNLFYLKDTEQKHLKTVLDVVI